MDRKDVLVLDDEQRILKALMRTLKSEVSDRIETTEDPHEALRILRERPPKVLITDFRMPVMNGVEVLREARRIAPDTIRILLTGQADQNDVIAAVNSGQIFRYVAKPWDNSAFAAVVCEAMESHDSALSKQQAFVEADSERRSLKAAVSIVSDIQRSILPETNIQVVGGDAACSFTPCEHATGDYVDAMVLPHGRTALIIGDVCGHGLGAALFVFTARALIRSGLAEGDEPWTVLERANQFLCRDMVDGRFLTLFLAIHDMKKERLAYINAGHNPAMILGELKITELTRTGLPLGVADHARYDEMGETPFAVGQTFFAYTDGVVEARNGEDVLFGKERLTGLLASSADRTPHEIVSAVRAAVSEFADGAEAQDDLALLAYAPSPDDGKPRAVAAV